MNITVCQCDIIWESPEENFGRLSSHIAKYVSQCADNLRPDIIVLPEFFTTGFSMNRDLAEDPQGKSVEWLIKTSSGCGAAIVGSLPITEGGKIFNRCFFVTPNAEIYHYDKRHLFRMSDEHEIYSPGGTKTIVKYKSWRIALNICYDLRFPVWSRNRKNEYDIMINVASWPRQRLEAATILAKARAIENLSYFIFANRVGESPEESYKGGSMIIDYKGNDISCRKNDPYLGEDGCFLSASLDIDKLKKFRIKFPAWKDADRFGYEEEF